MIDKDKKVSVSSKNSELSIVGLSERDIEYLAKVYSICTKRRNKKIELDGIDSRVIQGDLIIDKKAKVKGLLFLSNIMNRLEEFDSPLYVESCERGRRHRYDVLFKCCNKKGENLAVRFTEGNDIDYPTMLEIIGPNDAKTARILIERKVIFDYFSYSDARTEPITAYFKSIYDEAYGDGDLSKQRGEIPSSRTL